MSRLFVLLFLIVPLQAQTVAEQYLLNAINQERAAHSLSAVHIDLRLGRAAMGYAEEMARRGTISHQFPGEPELAERGSSAGVRFDRIAENVAEGTSIIGLHDALMHSSGHRANILDPAVDTIGVSVLSRLGRLYAVEDFAHTVAPLTLDQQEATVALLLDRTGLKLLSSAAARRTCALASGYEGDEPPAFIMRYTTADLGQLPVALSSRLRSGRERRAAVGACRPSASAFSQYSIAVLLFR